jgi:hypothetical protein
MLPFGILPALLLPCFACSGIADLLRILTQRPSEVLKPQEEEEDEEAEQEQREGQEDDTDDADDPQAAAAAADDDDEDSGGSDGPEEAAGAGADEQAASEDEETDQEQDDDLDDAAMMRLDAQLGNAVRSMINRGGAGARQRTAALLALQLRVAALMEEWLKKVSQTCSPSLFLAAVAGAVPERLPQHTIA